MWIWERIRAHPLGATATGIALFVIPGVIEPYWSLVSEKPLFEVLSGLLSTQIAGKVAAGEFIRSAMWLGGGFLIAMWAKSVTDRAISVPSTLSAMPPSRVSPLMKVMSEGILWQGNVYGAQAYCPEHEVALLFKRNMSGRIEQLGDSDAIDTNPYGSSFGQLFCAHDAGHTMLLEQSATYGEAKQRAEVLIRADLRKAAERSVVR